MNNMLKGITIIALIVVGVLYVVFASLKKPKTVEERGVPKALS